MTAVHPLDTPITRVLGALKGVKPAGEGKWTALCPVHGDRTPSLDIKLGKDGRVLFVCRANCSQADVLKGMGLRWEDVFPARPKPQEVGPYRPPTGEGKPSIVAAYQYVDEEGAALYEACRVEPGKNGKKKDFLQRHQTDTGKWVWNLNGIRRVLYRLPEVVEAVSMGRQVFVVEGEKDADTLAGEGYPATTNPMGAGKWSDEYSQALKGADVVVLPDNDTEGKAHAQLVANSLYGHGCTVRVVELPGLPEKGDVTDWLDAGHDLDELQTLIGATRIWSPSVTKRRWRLDEILSNEAIMRPPPPLVPYLGWAGRSTLIAARDKAGKSTLMQYLASQVSLRDGRFLGEPCGSGTVLILSLEEDMGDAARRLRVFGADATRVEIIPSYELPTDPRQRTSVLREEITAMKPSLVILDTLIAWGEGVVSDWASSAQTAPLVNGLTAISHETGAALFVVAHAQKQGQEYRDSTAIGGGVDAVAVMYAPNEDLDPTLRRLRVKGRMGNRTVQFRFLGNDYRLDEGREAPIEQRITTYVQDHPGCSANDTAESVGGNRSLVLTRITAMIAAGQLTDGTGGKGRKLYVPGDSPFVMTPVPRGTA